jgi:hypothetical protein
MKAISNCITLITEQSFQSFKISNIMKQVIFIFILAFMSTMTYGQLKVASSGDVGIGTSTPTVKLEVVGDALVRGRSMSMGTDAGALLANFNIGSGRSNNGQSAIELTADVTNFPLWGCKLARFGNGFTRFTHNGTAGLQFMAADNANVALLTQSVVRMTVRGDGNVGIGSAGSATIKLAVAGDVSGTSFIVSSDRRLKDGINTYDKGLDVVMKMNPVSYTYNGKAGITSTDNHIGLIAQELKKVAPEMVGEYTYTDMDMNEVVRAQEDYLYIKDSEIKYLLVNAIQEQQDMIEARDEQIDDLQSQLDELKKIVLNMQNGNTVNEQEVDLDSEVAYLKQNEPNPFVESTIVKYFLPEGSVNANLNIFSAATGQLIKTIKLTEVGHGQINITAGTIPSGNYTYQLAVDGNVIANKSMVLTR